MADAARRRLKFCTTDSDDTCLWNEEPVADDNTPHASRGSPIRTSAMWKSAPLVVSLGLLTALPASAAIEGVQPSSATVVQGGIVTASISGVETGNCVSASSPHASIVVTVVPACLSADHAVTAATTAVTPPGVYTVTFEERGLSGGPVVGRATLTITVTVLLPPVTATTSTSTTLLPPILPTTTSTISPPEGPPAPSSTTTTMERPVTSTSSTTLGPAQPPPTDPPGGTPPLVTTTTTSTTVAGDESEEDPVTIGGALGPDDGSGLPPPPEVVTAAPERTGIGGFLDPFLPAIVTDTLASPFYVLASIVSAAMDTGAGLILSVLVTLTFAAYLLRRWKAPGADEEATGG